MEEILTIKTHFNGHTCDEIIKGLQHADESELKFYQYEFYNRFAPYLYKAGLQRFRNFGDTEFLAKEVLQETFQKAFILIKSFNFPTSAAVPDHPKIIRGWLGSIANNESKKAIGKIINSKINYDSLKLPEPSYDPLNTLGEEEPVEIPNGFRNLLQQAMNKLSEKEKHIMLVYAGEGCVNSKFRLNKNTLKYLCEYYETTPEAIRQCKKRALDKIKEHCFRI